MQLQYGRNSNPRSSSWQGTSQDGTGKDKSCQGVENTNEDQGSKRIEDTNEGQGHRKFPWICQLLAMLYPELQPHSKTIE